MTSKKSNVGVIGCGNISDIYLTNAQWLNNIEVVGVTDLRMEMAQAQAEKYSIATVYDSVDEMLADSNIDLVLNITHPAAHGDVAQAAVEAGKSVYNEKPLTLSREQGKKLLATAKQNGVLVGCAPDTFLGAGHQTARKLIDDGAIGNPRICQRIYDELGHGDVASKPRILFQARRWADV